MVAALVAKRIVLEVPLVVLCRDEKVARRPLLDLRDNLAALWSKVLFLHLLCHFLGCAELVGIVREKCGAVLGAAVVALRIKLRWIMGTVEELDELGVGDLGLSRGELRDEQLRTKGILVPERTYRIELDLRGFRMTGAAGADLFVTWVLA